MTLKNEAQRIFTKLFGPKITNELDSFEDCEKYPKDFLDECTYFLGNLIGEDAAKKKFEPLYKRYVPDKKHGNPEYITRR